MLSDMQKLSENDAILGHRRYFTVTSLSKEVKNADSEIGKIEGIYLKPFTTQQIISLNLDKKIITALCEVGVDYPELSCGILLQIK